jgi:RHS repeat-associated protein
MVNVLGSSQNTSNVEVQLLWSGSIGQNTYIYRKDGDCSSNISNYSLIATVSGSERSYYDIIPSGVKITYRILSKSVCGGQTRTVGDSSCVEVEASPQTGSGLGTVYYYITDHLGSVRAILDSSGNIKSTHDFEPFGFELQPLSAESTNFKYKYTGQERDYDTGLDYMHFRYYASTMGRFLKPDNIIPNAFNPQSWNLYSYVNGNPVNFNDPSGHAMGSRPQFAYMEATHSFGMSWFDQFNWHSPNWSPWPGQTADNSWYYGSTRSAMGYYVNQYKQTLQNKQTSQPSSVLRTSIVPEILVDLFEKFIGLFHSENKFFSLASILISGGDIFTTMFLYELASNMLQINVSLAEGFVQGVDIGIFTEGAKAWETVLSSVSSKEERVLTGSEVEGITVSSEAIMNLKIEGGYSSYENFFNSNFISPNAVSIRFMEAFEVAWRRRNI